MAEVKEKRRFIITEKHIDKKSIKRNRTLMTPAVCDECGLDLVALNKLRKYDELTEVEQVKLKAAVQEHKRAAHDKSSAKIINEEDLPIAYLGKEVITNKDKEKMKDYYYD